MRVNLILLFLASLFGAFLWVILSGALLMIGSAFLLLAFVITIGYPDKAILFFLGARELRSRDEVAFSKTASQEAYKLAVPVPVLYFYSGSMDRGFVLQNKSVVSLVLSRSLLESLSESELHAVCFELLLQVKKGMAPKRTKVMFLLGSVSWAFHSVVSLITRLIPSPEVRAAFDWVLSYLLHPALELLFRLCLGTGYFRRLGTYLEEYPSELELLQRFGMKLREPETLYSLPSRKLQEFSAVSRSRQFRGILALEFLPHEWDLFFQNLRSPRAQ